MAETPTRAGPTQITTTATTIKTAGGASTWVLVNSCIVTNTHSAAITVNVGIDTAGTDTAAERIASGLTLQVGEVVELVAPGVVVLLGHASTPDMLYALASVATSGNVTLGCVEGP